MLKDKIQSLKSYADEQINVYLGNVRWSVLLIVVPAIFIVPIYFLTIVKEIVIDKRVDVGVSYEKRFAPVRQDLPAHAPFNYVADEENHIDFFFARYALIPARMVWGLTPSHDLLVAHNIRTQDIPSFEGYQLSKDYGNGIMLFKRSAD
jgi:hypothetical protein